MATVSIVQQPEVISPVYNTIPFKLQLSTGEEGNNWVSLIYQLEDDSGNIIVPISETSYTADGSLLDFWRDLASHVKTTFPQLGSPNIFDDELMVINYKLRYGVNLYDKTTLLDNPTLDQESSVKAAYLGAIQFKGGTLFGSLGHLEVLSMRPTENYTSIYTNDWLWILPSPSLFQVELNVTIFYKSGLTSTVSNVQTPDEAPVCFPIGPANGFWVGTSSPASIVRYTVEVIATPTGIGSPAPVSIGTYSFSVSSDCEEDLKQVIWKEPTGGYAGTYFEEAKELLTISSGKIIKTYSPRDASPPTDPGRNNSISNFAGQRKVTLRKTLPYSEDAKFFFDGLITSNDIKVEETLLNGDRAVFRLMKDPGGTTHFNSEEYLTIQLTGVIGPDIISPRR